MIFSPNGTPVVELSTGSILKFDNLGSAATVTVIDFLSPPQLPPSVYTFIIDLPSLFHNEISIRKNSFVKMWNVSMKTE